MSKKKKYIPFGKVKILVYELEWSAKKQMKGFDGAKFKSSKPKKEMGCFLCLRGGVLHWQKCSQSKPTGNYKFSVIRAAKPQQYSCGCCLRG